MIKRVKSRITRLLTDVEVLRDDDNRLVANVWFSTIKDKWGIKEFEKMSAQSFLQAYAQGQIIPADTITRARRKIQEQNPLLRGKQWESRHILADKTRTESFQW